MEDKKCIGLNAEGKEELFPQIWMNKSSAEVFHVVPWMQVMKGDEIVATPIPDVADDGKPQTVRAVFGALAQIGWMIENGHGVHLGVGLNVESHFEKISEL